MSTELQDAFAQAAQGAKAEFETRNAVDVIEPAARRVTRHRASLWVGAGLASVALLAGVVWGVGAVADSRNTTIDPAVPDAPDVNADVPGNAWDTLDLAVRAQPRQQGKLRNDSTAGMICHHAQPTDDPRIAAKGDDPTVSHRSSLEDCRAVWFANGPSTTLSSWSVSASTLDHSFTYNYSIHNESAQPIAVDAASVYMWIETAPDDTSDTATTYASTLVGGSMWDASGDVTALLDSGSEPAVIAPDGTYTSSITATTGTADGDALADLLANGDPYRVSLWARIHQASPGGDSSYLIRLGSNNDASWRATGDGAENDSAWTVDDLAAVTTPRAQGETRSDATAGMVCHKSTRDSDPQPSQGDESASSKFAPANCDPVWFVGGPTTISFEKSALTLSDVDGTLSCSWELTNSSDRPLNIDTGSTFMWLETDPTRVGRPAYAVDSGVLVGPSMWAGDNTVVGALSNDTSWQSIEPGATVSGNKEVQHGDNADWPLGDRIPAAEPVTISVWAAVTDPHADGQTTYIIQLGLNTVYLATDNS